MAAKLLNLLAVSSLAVIVCSFGSTPVNALSLSSQHIARHIPAHDVMAKKKRSNNKRCRSRGSSSSSNASSYSGDPSDDVSTNDDPSDGGSNDPSGSSAPSDSYSPSDVTYSPSGSSTPSDPSDDSSPPDDSGTFNNATAHPGSHSHGSNNNGGGGGGGGSDGGSDDTSGGSDVSNASSTPSASNTPSTSVTPAASGNIPSSGGSGHKVGIAWPNGEDDSLKNFKTDRVTMLYTWSPSCPSQSKALGFNCIPMLWGASQTDSFQQLVVQGYADTVFGFNEPNEAGQANLSPDDAAQLWQQYISPLQSQGYRLISPGTSSNPNGKTWMQDFFSACSGCHFDGVAAHWYDVGSQKFIDYMTDFHNTFNMDIWVTEFACQNFNGGAQCTQDEANSFMTDVINFMDSTDWIAAYFAFGVMRDMQGVSDVDRLMNDDGTPTALGQLYINGPSS